MRNSGGREDGSTMSSLSRIANPGTGQRTFGRDLVRDWASSIHPTFTSGAYRLHRATHVTLKRRATTMYL